MGKSTDLPAVAVETYPRVQLCTVDWQWRKIIKEALHDPGRWHSDARDCAALQRQDGGAAEPKSSRRPARSCKRRLRLTRSTPDCASPTSSGKPATSSAGFRTTEEFASGAAYEGRKDLGNVKKGDGRRYKGRGLLQLTGRANYAEYGKALGVDLENNPAMAAEPALSLKIACEYWKRRKLNADCDRDDIRATTRRINGGLNGLKDRSNYIRKAKEALARIEGIQLDRRGVRCTPGLAAWFHRRRGRRPAGHAEQAQISPRHRSGFRRRN